MMKLGAWMVVMVVALMGFGCGEDEVVDDSDGGGSDGECEQAMAVLCDKACGCATGESSCLYFDPEGGFNSTASDAELCVDMACMDAPDMDFAACASAVDAASCEDGMNGEPGLALPEECLAITEF